jgi:response regulator RpfG family c-di-GMP phosphodiesterase
MNEDSDPAAPAPPTRCLIVDDEPRLRQVLLRVMRADGYACSEASDGAHALEVLEREPVSLVLTDLRMPRMDGLELLRQVRVRHPDTAVVLVTAVADVDVAVSCFAIGAMDYVTKPFHLEEVRARVLQALDKRRLIIENRDYRAHLEERVAAQARRLEQLFIGSVQALAEALDVKDAYTRGHSVRVGHYSAAVARQLRLPDDVVRQIELGGQVHDIGKIGVREAVLNKPGPLTEDEYEHIMTHPLLGWRILLPLLGDTPRVLNVVRSHHERYDGSGGPDALAGEAIPLEARIAAVADAFDAMTSGRPYRAVVRRPVRAALDELRRVRGTQFDPAVVDVFTGAVERGLITIPADRYTAGAPTDAVPAS